MDVASPVPPAEPGRCSAVSWRPMRSVSAWPWNCTAFAGNSPHSIGYVMGVWRLHWCNQPRAPNDVQRALKFALIPHRLTHTIYFFVCVCVGVGVIFFVLIPAIINAGYSRRQGPSDHLQEKQLALGNGADGQDVEAVLRRLRDSAQRYEGPDKF